jgi:hypothetical protein
MQRLGPLVKLRQIEVVGNEQKSLYSLNTSCESLAEHKHFNKKTIVIDKESFGEIATSSVKLKVSSRLIYHLHLR